jgi:hypothetical protein
LKDKPRIFFVAHSGIGRHLGTVFEVGRIPRFWAGGGVFFITKNLPLWLFNLRGCFFAPAF